MGRAWQDDGAPARIGARRTEPAGDPAGVIIVAAAAVLVGVSVIAAGVGAGATWVFEVLAATGVLVGLGVAFGALDGGLRLPWRRLPRRPEPAVAAGLAAALEAELARLDPVEHRRLDLGAPWPVVIVGPTGVSLVSPLDRIAASHLAMVREVALEIRRVVASVPTERPIVVRTAVVVPAVQGVGVAPADVAVLTAGDVPGFVARGPMVSMATAASLFTLLSGHLAPDLPVNS